MIRSTIHAGDATMPRITQPTEACASSLHVCSPPAERRVPRWVRKIVARGLRAAPAARWPSMDALVTALARGRHRQRHRTIAIARSVLIAGAVIGVTLLGRGEASPHEIHEPPSSAPSRPQGPWPGSDRGPELPD